MKDTKKVLNAEELNKATGGRIIDDGTLPPLPYDPKDKYDTPIIMISDREDTGTLA